MLEITPIGIGGQAFIRFYNAATDEEKLTAARSTRGDGVVFDVQRGCGLLVR